MTTDHSTPDDPPPSPPLSPGQLRGPGPNELRLSVALRKVLEERGDQTLTLGYIVDKTGERSLALAVLMAFLCLPFLQPIPIPGVSIPFGLLLTAMAIQLIFGRRHPWLPKRLANWKLPQKTTTVLLRAVAKVFKPLEKIIKPRWLILQNHAMFILLGLAIAIDGILLTVLPPIPGSNFIPAWMAMVKILGITEEDSLTMLVGFALSAAVAAAIAIGFIFFYEETIHFFRHGFAATTQPATTPATLP